MIAMFLTTFIVIVAIIAIWLAGSMMFDWLNKNGFHQVVFAIQAILFISILSAVFTFVVFNFETVSKIGAKPVVTINCETPNSAPTGAR
jgi:hypothetical protein